MKDFVRIQATRSVEVYPGMQYVNMTNPDAHVGDRLRVAATWVNSRVMLKQGAFDYPAEIQDWETVRALARDKVITIGEELDDTDDATALELKLRLANAKDRYNAMVKETAADPLVGGTRKRKTVTED